jgi:dolichol-phosphate mannosyltransferase
VEEVELAVIMPVYNEEEVISKTVGKWTEELKRHGINFRIHAYNDGSKDDTLKKLSDIAEQNERLVVHNKSNSGHGPTILQGYRENSNVEWVFQIDSDDEMGPESFLRLWGRRKNYDFLIGKRDGRFSPLARKAISFISRITVQIFYGKGVWDVNSPYRLMRTESFKDIFLRIPADTFAPNVIISGVVCLKRDLRILEVLVPHQNRRTGKVALKKWKLFRAAMKSFFQTVRVRFKNWDTPNLGAKGYE